MRQTEKTWLIMKNITKNQHYVPKVLLRGFTINDTNNLLVYDLENNFFCGEQNIRRTCSADFFYDTNNKVETDILGQIENIVGNHIKSLKNGSFDILKDLEVRKNLIRFACVQLFRTVFAQSAALDMINKTQMALVKEIIDLNMDKLGPVDDYGYFNYNEDNKRDISGYLTSNAVLKSLAMNDLKIHVLENQNKTDFITSDNPAVMYNWLFRNDKINPLTSSPMAIGVQIFLPISKSLCLCFFDPKVYKFGKVRNRFNSSISENDVNWLNKLQLSNGSNKIIFPSKSMLPFIEKHKHLVNKPLYKHFFYNKDNLLINGSLINYSLTEKPTFFKLLQMEKLSATLIEYREYCKTWIPILNQLSNRENV